MYLSNKADQIWSDSLFKAGSVSSAKLKMMRDKVPQVAIFNAGFVSSAKLKMMWDKVPQVANWICLLC